MKVSKSRQQAYRRELDGLAEDAHSFVGSLLAAEMEAYPNASVSEMREMAKRAISDSLFAFGDQAANLAGELFDEIVSAESIAAKWVNENTIDPVKVDSKVRYFADVLKGDATDADKMRFRKDCTALTRDYVKRNAFENMIRNCDRENVRWARVPSGAETCSFCYMLASRGFDYLSKESADAVRHGRHKHCDCIIIPGIKGKTVIDGYDPDALYDRWSMCADTVGIDPATRSSAKRRRIMREVETRDWKWLHSPRKDYSCVVEYAEDWNNDERDVADRLGLLGFNVQGIKGSKKFHDRRGDMLLNGADWEMKNPEGCGEMTVFNQFKKAVMGKAWVNNPQSKRLVISNFANSMSFERLESKIQSVIDASQWTEIEEVLAVGRDGELRRWKR